MRHLEGLSSEISLLHMNCEGCEWEMLENLLKDTDLIKKVRYQAIRTVGNMQPSVGPCAHRA